MKKVFSIIMIIALVLSLVACGDQTDSTTLSKENDPTMTSTTEVAEKLEVITTLFPQYDFAKRIAGDLAEVRLLLSPGVEAHSYEPTPKDIIDMGEADIVFFTNVEMEPWVQKIAESTGANVFDLSQSIELMPFSHDHGHSHDHDHDGEEKDHDHDHDGEEKDHDHDHDGEEKDHDHDHDGEEKDHDHDHDGEEKDHDHDHDGEEKDHDHDHDGEEKDHDHDHKGHNHKHMTHDPHYWLDVKNAVIMAEEIRDQLIILLPEKKEILEKQAQELISELEILDNEVSETVSTLDNDVLVSAGHFAFGYFAKRYGVTAISPFHGLSPNAEPTPKKMAEIVDFCQENHVKAIYFEELLNPALAETLSHETGAKMLLLHAAHNVSKQEVKEQLTYIQIMRNNLKNLEEGQGVKK